MKFDYFLFRLAEIKIGLVTTPMEKAYIILAHKNPEQVKRLIAALDDNHSTFFLHIDKKADLPQWREISLHTKGVVAIESVSTVWGGFGLVEVTLHSMQAAMNHHKQFEFISVISGQHYPIKSNKYISDYLCNSEFRIFLEYTSIPDYERWERRGGLYRIDKYFLGLRAHERYTAKVLNLLSNKINIFRRKFPKNMKPYGGSQWFTIDNHAMKYILNFVKNNPGYSAFHKYTFAPDELFFHNILLNADDQKIKSRITNNNLLYMKWPDRNTGHPEILNSSDLQAITSSDALFARKFDMQHDACLLDLIDRFRSHENQVIEQRQDA